MGVLVGLAVEHGLADLPLPHEVHGLVQVLQQEAVRDDGLEVNLAARHQADGVRVAAHSIARNAWTIKIPIFTEETNL